MYSLNLVILILRDTEHCRTSHYNLFMSLTFFLLSLVEVAHSLVFYFICCTTGSRVQQKLVVYNVFVKSFALNEIKLDKEFISQFCGGWVRPDLNSKMVSESIQYLFSHLLLGHRYLTTWVTSKCPVLDVKEMGC